MYRIRWTATKTGKTGHGTGMFHKAEAILIKKQLNADPENKGWLTYQIEEVKGEMPSVREKKI